MELYFIRHGQSYNNANWGMEGFIDVPDPNLTEIGQTQARYLANFLGKNQTRDENFDWNSQNEHGFGLTHLYTSLMVRAVETAIPVAKTIHLPLVGWIDIHETGGIFSRTEGDELKGLPGKTRAFFEEHYPTLNLPSWLDENGWWNRPFEIREARQPRAESVWRELLARHGDRPGEPEHRVAIVSHGGFFNYLLTSALGVQFPILDENRHQFWFLINNCGITRIDHRDGQTLICYINRHDFLPDHLLI